MFINCDRIIDGYWFQFVVDNKNNYYDGYGSLLMTVLIDGNGIQFIVYNKINILC